MSFQFKRGIREQVKVLIGIAGPSGSGKTYSALRLARGLVGKGGKIAFIDTEARRGLHYAEQFTFDHLDLETPFTPSRYLEAIQSAESGGYDVAIIDSASHEHAGDGGILDMHESELTRMAGDDYRKRESCNMAAWIKPKGEHKKFVSRLLQCRMHIIFCFRAEEKIKMVKDEETKKTKIVPIGWQPICEKNLPYEMTVSFIVSPDKPGFPIPVKLQEQHKGIFPLDQALSEKSGELLAVWAAGGVSQNPPIAEIPKATKPPSVKQWLDRIGKIPTPVLLSDAKRLWADSCDKYLPEEQKQVIAALDAKSLEFDSDPTEGMPGVEPEPLTADQLKAQIDAIREIDDFLAFESALQTSHLTEGEQTRIRLAINTKRAALKKK